MHVPNESVPLFKDVTYDMERDDVNTLGQDTMFQASCCVRGTRVRGMSLTI